MLTILKMIGKSFVDLLYPPLCLHCDESLEKGCYIFCKACQEQLELIDPSLRCPFCFSSEFDQQKQKFCQECQKKSKNMRIASAFDYEGPPATLVKLLKYANQTYLAKGGGAYLATQFLTLNWPMPDYIIPMPMSSLKKLERGYNQSQLLSESFSRLINRPVSLALKRKSGDYSQAGLNHQQRIQLKSDSFFVRNGDHLFDKNLLIIDDVMTTGSSLQCCAEVLTPFFPQSIYALTLCRAI